MLSICDIVYFKFMYSILLEKGLGQICIVFFDKIAPHAYRLENLTRTLIQKIGYDVRQIRHCPMPAVAGSF